MRNTLYAPKQTVESPNGCDFYHTIDLPGYGLMSGAWDLRPNVDDYLGRVDFKNKKVLEVGTANGYLCFEMERRGADVTGYDLSPAHDWDFVPFEGKIDETFIQKRKNNIGRLNKAWWLTHRCFKSSAKVVYGSVYEIPEAIGPVHISTFGSILLHLRDPFLALQKAANVTTETMIITDLMPNHLSIVPASHLFFKKILWNLFKPQLTFLPDPATKSPNDTWWVLPPDIICRFLNMLGFPNQEVTYHTQNFNGKPLPLYTVVGRRVK